jgi:hypothetical protein
VLSPVTSSGRQSGRVGIGPDPAGLLLGAQVSGERLDRAV